MTQRNFVAEAQFCSASRVRGRVEQSGEAGEYRVTEKSNVYILFVEVILRL